MKTKNWDDEIDARRKARERLEAQYLKSLPNLPNLPCPFCGSAVEIKVMIEPHTSLPKFKIGCSDWDKCQMQSETGFEDDFMTAHKNWNRRNPPNDQKLSHAADDIRKPETRSDKRKAQSALAPALC